MHNYIRSFEKGAVALGVSKHSVTSHKKFEEKYELPLHYCLVPLSYKAYDVWKEKNIMERRAMGLFVLHI